MPTRAALVRPSSSRRQLTIQNVMTRMTMDSNNCWSMKWRIRRCVLYLMFRRSVGTIFWSILGTHAHWVDLHYKDTSTHWNLESRDTTQSALVWDLKFMKIFLKSVRTWKTLRQRQLSFENSFKRVTLMIFACRLRIMQTSACQMQFTITKLRVCKMWKWKGQWDQASRPGVKEDTSLTLPVPVF